MAIKDVIKESRQILSGVLYPYRVATDVWSAAKEMRAENKKMKRLSQEIKQKNRKDVRLANLWSVSQGVSDSLRPLLIKSIGAFPLAGALGSFLGLTFLSSYITTKCQYHQGNAFNRVDIQTRGELAKEYLKSSCRNAEQYKVRAPNVAKATQDFVVATSKSWQAVTTGVLCLGVLSSMSWISTAIIAGVAAYSGAKSLVDLKAIKNEQNAKVTALNAVQAKANKVVDAADIIKETNNIPQMNKTIQQEVEQANERVKEYYEKQAEINRKSMPVSSLISASFWGSSLISSISAGAAGDSYLLGAATFAGAMMASERVIQAISDYVQQHKERIQSFREYEKNINELDYSKTKVRTGEKELSTSNGHLKVQGVHFAYEGSDRGVSDINTDFHRGQVTVLTGESGSGKSTLFNLLRHQMDPNAGKITLDEVPLTDLRQESINSQIAYIAQKPVFLKGTIAEEMHLFNADATPQKMQKCLTRAGLKGMDIHTPVYNEDGTPALSGGQMQRVAIARALVKDAPILLMDEPTTGLDAATKDDVWETIQSLKKDKTIVIVSHDSYEIMKSDRAVLLEEGRITQDGNPVTLHTPYFERMRQKAAEIVDTQKQKFQVQTSGLKSVLQESQSGSMTDKSVPSAVDYQQGLFLPNRLSSTR